MTIIFVIANTLTLVAIMFVILDSRTMRDNLRIMKQTLDMRTDILNRIESDLKENREHIDRIAGKQVSMDINDQKLIEAAELKAAKIEADEMRAKTVKADALHVDTIVTRNGRP